MKVRYFLNSVNVTPTHVNIRRGLTSIKIPREAVVGIEVRPLTGKIVFLTQARRYKVVLWHGFGRIKRELGYA